MATVKQAKDVLEEMKTIYEYKDECTEIDLCSESIRVDRNIVRITTIDEETGIRIYMQKEIKSE